MNIWSFFPLDVAGVIRQRYRRRRMLDRIALNSSKRYDRTKDERFEALATYKGIPTGDLRDQ